MTAFVTVHAWKAPGESPGPGPFASGFSAWEWAASGACVTCPSCSGPSCSGPSVSVPFGPGPSSRPAPDGATPSLLLGVRSGGRCLLLLARLGRRADRLAAFDEHFVVDTDVDRGSRRYAFADVVTASRPRPARAAAHRLGVVLARCPAAAFAGVPLAGGGWAARTPRENRPVLLGQAVTGNPLLPSCLHAWLVAGGTLAELAVADLVVWPAADGVSPPPACPAPGPGDPAVGGRRPGW